MSDWAFVSFKVFTMQSAQAAAQQPRPAKACPTHKLLSSRCQPATRPRPASRCCQESLDQERRNAQRKANATSATLQLVQQLIDAGHGPAAVEAAIEQTLGEQQQELLNKFHEASAEYKLQVAENAMSLMLALTELAEARVKNAGGKKD